MHCNPPISGEHDTSTTRESRSLKIPAKPFGIDRHYGYREQTRSRDQEQGVWNDFALIELSTKVDFAQNPHIRPVCLPTNDHIEYKDERGTVVGWGNQVVTYESESLDGLVKGKGSKNSDRLQKLELRLDVAYNKTLQ